MNTRETYTHLYFYGGIFSNFYSCKLTVDGQTYLSVEQYYMNQKALHFKDLESSNKIMLETKSPKIKRLGNNKRIKGFNKESWDDVKVYYMHKGCEAKFSQNTDLKEKLLATGDRTLVEASPYDSEWGIGLGLDSDLIIDETKWQGKNLLGITLGIIRYYLSK